MSIATEIERIQNAKASIKTAIENKGVVVGDGLVDTYASKIEEITGGLDIKINNCVYLFKDRARLDFINEICSLISEDCELFYYMYDGCSESTEFPVINTSNGTHLGSMYYNCKALEYAPLIDTSNATNMGSMHGYNIVLKESPAYNTSKATNVGNMYSRCYDLMSIPLLDFGNVNTISDIVYSCNNLTNLGGFKDLGKAYTKTTANYGSYTLNLSHSSKLTHESLMNVINNLYDLNLSYNVAGGGTLYTQKLVLGSTNLAKLSSDELSIATNKGWVVS